jgi:hypothetical protein
MEHLTISLRFRFHFIMVFVHKFNKMFSSPRSYFRITIYIPHEACLGVPQNDAGDVLNLHGVPKAPTDGSGNTIASRNKFMAG